MDKEKLEGRSWKEKRAVKNENYYSLSVKEILLVVFQISFGKVKITKYEIYSKYLVNKLEELLIRYISNLF